MFDVAIIGGGPGGYTAAAMAAQKGLSVALFEYRELGGTCLNRGCMPTKALIHSADTLEHALKGESMGINATASCDFAAMHARKAEVVASLRAGVEKLMKANKVTVINEKAQIAGAGRIKAGEEEYEAKNIIIATGSVVSMPPIPGHDLPGVVTSNEILEGEGVPCESMVIIGGGVIGLECASIYSTVGAKVTVIEMADHILPLMDKEVAQRVAMIYKKKGVDILTKSGVKSIAQGDEGMVVTYTDKKGNECTVCAEKVLMAAGRRANTAGLFAENAEADGFLPEMWRGAIVADEYGRTNIDGLYVIGDAKAKNIQLAHVAVAQGKNVVSIIAGEEPEVNTKVIPSAVYTTPEVASVGLSEAECKEQGISIRTGKCLTGANGKSLIENSESGYVKIIVDAETDVILGASMVCHRASDLIGELTVAVATGMTLKALKSVVHPHPTFCEMIAEAAEAVR